VADATARSHAVRLLPADRDRREEAIAALDACVRFLADEVARYGQDPTWGLPDGFDEYWFVLNRDFTERMPTLADVSPEVVGRWLTEFDLSEVFETRWTTPPAEVVDAVTRYWVSANVHGITDDLIGWLRGHLTEDGERARVLATLRSAVSVLPWRIGIIAVPAIADLGGAAEREFLARTATDPATPVQTREEAASALRGMSP
jgi:hypothetical protein